MPRVIHYKSTCKLTERVASLRACGSYVCPRAQHRLTRCCEQRQEAEPDLAPNSVCSILQ